MEKISEVIGRKVNGVAVSSEILMVTTNETTVANPHSINQRCAATIAKSMDTSLLNVVLRRLRRHISWKRMMMNHHYLWCKSVSL